MIDEIFEKDGVPRPAGCIAINNLRARKEAVRAGVGITVLPNFTVTDEIQRKTLKILAVEGVRLPDIRLMIVEARRRTSNANIERVRKVLEETLLVGSRHH